MRKLSGKETLVPAIALALRRQIWYGELAPGEHINQRELADTLRVSVIPVREALQVLQSEGLVEISAHRGAQVTPVTAREVDEWLLEVVCMVGCLLPITVPMLTEPALARLRLLIPALDSPLGQVDNNLEHWNLILAPLAMPRVQHLVEQLLWRTGRFRHCLGWAVVEGMRNTRPNRQDFLEAIEARDGVRAAALFLVFATVRARVLQDTLQSREAVGS